MSNNKHLTLSSLFDDIADAIRNKNGTENTIVADNFDTEIGNLNTGINLSDAASAGDILSGKQAVVNNTVITGTINSKAAETYTPTTTDQTIASGQYLSGVQTISGDANLVAGNIKKNVSIFGVTGTMSGSQHAAAGEYETGNALAIMIGGDESISTDTLVLTNDCASYDSTTRILTFN